MPPTAPMKILRTGSSGGQAVRPHRARPPLSGHSSGLKGDDSSASLPPRFPSLRLRRLLILSAAIALLAGLGFVFIRHLIDFPVYYAAGRSLISGRTDLYAPDFARGPTMDYRYPPFFIVSLIPLWHLPYRAAAYLWHLLGVGGIVACCWATSQALLQGRQTSSDSVALGQVFGRGRVAIRTLVLTLLGVAQYYVMALHYGNAQLLVTALLLCGVALAIRNQSLAPGVLLALAITIKITPALLLTYFGLKRRWKLVMTTIGLVVVLNLAPAAYFGFARNAELVRTWYQHVLVDQQFHEVNGPINLSLKGQLVRSLTRVDYQQRLDGDTDYPEVNIAEFSYRDVNKLWLALDLAVLALGLFLISWVRPGSPVVAQDGILFDSTQDANLRHERRRPIAEPRLAAPETDDEPLQAAVGTSRKQQAIDSTSGSDATGAPSAPAAGAAGVTFEIGIMLCLLLLVEPLTSKIYFVALIWPLAALLDLVVKVPAKIPRLVRWGATAVVVTNVVLPLLPGREIQRLLLVLGADFYLNCLILAMLVWSLLAHRRAALN